MGGGGGVGNWGGRGEAERAGCARVGGRGTGGRRPAGRERLGHGQSPAVGRAGRGSGAGAVCARCRQTLAGQEAVAAGELRNLRISSYFGRLRGAEGIDNVVARSGNGAPCLALNCHIDTVDAGERADWRTDPFQAVLEDGVIYGLGANNCKGSTALHIWLGEEIMRAGGLQRGEIIFTFTGDEERLGPDGMAYLRESGALKPDIMLVGGPTGNHLITEERGVLWLRVTRSDEAPRRERV